MASTGTWIVQALRALVSDLDGQRSVTLEEAEAYKWRIEMIYRDLLAKDTLDVLSAGETEALTFIGQAHGNFSRVFDAVAKSQPTHTEAPIVMTGTVGRPAYDIPLVQLEYLVESRFSVPQISNLLGVSVSTIRRRMSMYNLSIRETFSSLSDHQLDEKVQEAHDLFPAWGYRSMYGHLLSQGIRVQYRRVRESLSRVDPEGSVMRRLSHIRRRQYSVPGPQYMWHVDGNHKLIR